MPDKPSAPGTFGTDRIHAGTPDQKFKNPRDNRDKWDAYGTEPPDLFHSGAVASHANLDVCSS